MFTHNSIAYLNEYNSIDMIKFDYNVITDSFDISKATIQNDPELGLNYKNDVALTNVSDEFFIDYESNMATLVCSATFNLPDIDSIHDASNSMLIDIFEQLCENI